MDIRLGISRSYFRGIGRSRRIELVALPSVGHGTQQIGSRNRQSLQLENTSTNTLTCRFPNERYAGRVRTASRYWRGLDKCGTNPVVKTLDRLPGVTYKVNSLNVAFPCRRRWLVGGLVAGHHLDDVTRVASTPVH